MKRFLRTAAVLIFAVLFSGCYSWFENKISMSEETKNISLEDFLYEPGRITSLNPPEQVLVSQGLYSGSIKISWTEVENARTYRIERAIVKPDSNGEYAEPDEGDFKVINKYVYTTNYTDTIISNLTDSKNVYANEAYSYKYYYKISAENLIKNYESSDYSPVTEDTCGWLFPAPQSTEAWKGKSLDKIKITWDKVENATKYLIYRGEDNLRTGDFIASVKGSSNEYTDTIAEKNQGQEYYYQVKAVLSNGTESVPGAFALGYTLKDGAPQAPSNVRVENGLGTSTTSLTVKWDAVTSGKGTVTYSLFKTSSIDSSYTVVKSNIAQNITSITDNDVVTGIKYYYYVQSVITDENNEKTKSSFSETGPESAAPAMGFLLSPPSIIDIADGTTEDTVTVRWQNPVGFETQTVPFRFNIYFSSNQNDNYTPAMQGILPVTQDSEGYYYIELAKHSFFRISTVNSSDKESDLSTVAAPNPNAPINVTATKTQKFDGFESYSPNKKNVYPVKITWNNPVGEVPYGYNVYRSTKRDSSFRLLNDEPLTNVNYYIDQNETAQPGTMYYYKVVSVNILGNGKKGNDPMLDTQNNCRGYGALTADEWFREYNKTVMNSQRKLTLMHKSNDMDKLGSETVNGTLSGTLYYNAEVKGLGAAITMKYTNYADFYINNDSAEGYYFFINGNTDTEANMSGNGTMHKSTTSTGMYPGIADYENLQIKSGAAGGGYYKVTTKDLNGNIIFTNSQVNWTVGEEGRK
ncbi:MAG: hypothetical protein K6E97_09340 [Treponema sp.]|nr:hypothetical protein [Treponema sp.]